MKQLLIIFIGVLLYTDNFSQSCLPEGIAFTSQAQIDSFQINYPNCTEIEGDVLIDDNVNTNIYNLNGLGVLNSIGGSLTIEYNSHLKDLTGLAGIGSIGGDLRLSQNHSVVNLIGFESLISVGGTVNISIMYDLMNLTGLNNLTSIGEHLYIQQNDLLTSLIGLDALTSVGGDVFLWFNRSLINLTGLEDLNSIGGSLGIYRNDDLINLSGLEGLSYIPGNLEIGNDIYYGNFSLISLSGLQGLTSIGGNLLIARNYDLLSLTGLEGLTTIGGDFGFWSNQSLPNFIGLDALSSIGGDLLIGNFTLGWGGGQSLIDFMGLEGLTSIGGDLVILANNSLRSLSGLENIEAGSISNLSILVNPNLSSCDIQSICDYLVAPNGLIWIEQNATGCNSQEEVEAACEVSLDETYFNKNQVSIYPNPSYSSITIENYSPDINSLLSVFNINGQKLEQQRITKTKTVIDLNQLPAGIYTLRITSDDKTKMYKLVKN